MELLRSFPSFCVSVKRNGILVHPQEHTFPLSEALALPFVTMEPLLPCGNAYRDSLEWCLFLLVDNKLAICILCKKNGKGWNIQISDPPPLWGWEGPQKGQFCALHS